MIDRTALKKANLIDYDLIEKASYFKDNIKIRTNSIFCSRFVAGFKA